MVALDAGHRARLDARQPLVPIILVLRIAVVVINTMPARRIVLESVFAAWSADSPPMLALASAQQAAGLASAFKKVGECAAR